MAPNDIYQYSLISALMSGLASPSTSTTLSALLPHGSLGLGTLAHMDGEMLLLDSGAYQFHADGSTNRVVPTHPIPFALVAHFQPQLTLALALPSKQTLLETIERVFPHAKNSFVIFKLTGVFRRVRVRAVHRQEYEGQKLAELASKQTEKVLRDVEGTVVGVRSPGWSVGISVVGVHAHFIDEGRAVGGHVLEVEGEGEVVFEGAVGGRFVLDVPTGREFGEREIGLDVGGIEKAEG